jgi:hypothetical protein
MMTIGTAIRLFYVLSDLRNGRQPVSRKRQTRRRAARLACHRQNVAPSAQNTTTPSDILDPANDNEPVEAEPELQAANDNKVLDPLPATGTE